MGGSKTERLGRYLSITFTITMFSSETELSSKLHATLRFFYFCYNYYKIFVSKCEGHTKKKREHG